MYLGRVPRLKSRHLSARPTDYRLLPPQHPEPNQTSCHRFFILWARNHFLGMGVLDPNSTQLQPSRVPLTTTRLGWSCTLCRCSSAHRICIHRAFRKMPSTRKNTCLSVVIASSPSLSVCEPWDTTESRGTPNDVYSG